MTAYVQTITITLKSDSKQLIEDLRVNAYADLDILLKAGVFSFKNGMAEIHRDNDGKIREINLKQKTFKT